ncbi:MAG: hypothetical protein JW913_20775 [Chitinispirillaceae bacterium]|nr:hypothetical protein [Chitinispirillaceae bacterium]
MAPFPASRYCDHIASSTAIASALTTVETALRYITGASGDILLLSGDITRASRNIVDGIAIHYGGIATL